ncbi:MAG: type II toxin-antitoxin system RelE/ParE family toxin [Patescibacteria group bacterium]
MKAYYSPSFKTQLKSFPELVRRKFNKQIQFLIQNLRHPSLHAKKYDETEGVWQARVDKSVRFYFLIDDETYVLLEIKNHPK